jgi:alkylation response protein AidB-like acyl-CoA dehydrogenase
MLTSLPDSARGKALLQGIAEGTAVVELGGPLCASESTPPLSACGGAQGWRLSGETADMTLTADCTQVLLVCRNADDGEWMLVAAAAERLRGMAESVANPGLAGGNDASPTARNARFSGYRTMDDRAVAFCRLEGMAIEAVSILAVGPEAERAIRAGWRMAVATDTVSAMGGTLARTIAYLLERRQFGQPLAQFQALRHEVARLYVTYETGRNLLQASLRSMDTVGSMDVVEKTADPAEDVADDVADEAAFALLGLYAGQEAIPFGESSIQLHGGMGMTREMPAAQLATRLMANAFRFGDPLAHRHSLHDLRTRKPS